jgi:transposase-like protein
MNKGYTNNCNDLSLILPSIELLEKSRSIVESTLKELGRLTLETILSMSAVEVAGEPKRGKKKGAVLHHGSQRGHVNVSGKRIPVDHPRLRSRDGKEIPVPAYETLKHDPDSADRALSRVMRGISTREYEGIFDEAGEELGLSKSNVSRQVIEASEKALKELTERKIATRQIAIMIDGIHIGKSVILAAVGIDESGTKQVLGLQEGATENSVAVGSLLDSMIERGLNSELPTLFILDGAKALTKAVQDRFQFAQIQRCRVHKIRNVLDHLPLEKRRYYKAKMNLAYRLPYEEALEKLNDLAHELEVLHPGAAGSLKEGLSETLTVSRLAVSPLLAQSLSTTNVIESSFSRARHRLKRVTNVSSGSMSLRWCASALSLAEENFRTIKGVKDLWMLRTAIDNPLEVISK